jgi:hypothetical protein
MERQIRHERGVIRRNRTLDMKRRFVLREEENDGNDDQADGHPEAPFALGDELKASVPAAARHLPGNFERLVADRPRFVHAPV